MNVYSLGKGKSSKLIQSYDFGKQVKGFHLDPNNLAGSALYLV